MSTYTVSAYGSMMADPVRMRAYEQALARCVTPATVVLDLGAGTGIMALVACRLGAQRVVAVEPDAVIEVARRLAAANGCGDRIEFHQCRLADLHLPASVDGIVWDLRGVLPFFEEGLVALMDARDRLLTPGGTIIPLRDTVWAAPVDAPEVYRRHFRGWDESACGFDLQGGRRLVAQSWSKATVAADQLLAEPGCWVALDYRQIQGPDADATVTWIVRRDGTGHGFAAWFETELAEGIGFSNAPDQPELLYGQAFFPWPEPVPLRAGDEVSVHWQARLVGRDYVWAWDSTIRRGEARPVRFRQSTFLGTPYSAHDLTRMAPAHQPALNAEGQLLHFLLDRMRGQRTVAELAAAAAAQFPGRFASLEQARGFVAELCTRFS